MNSKDEIERQDRAAMSMEVELVNRFKFRTKKGGGTVYELVNILISFEILSGLPLALRKTLATIAETLAGENQSNSFNENGVPLKVVLQCVSGASLGVEPPALFPKPMPAHECGRALSCSSIE